MGKWGKEEKGERRKVDFIIVGISKAPILPFF